MTKVPIAGGLMFFVAILVQPAVGLAGADRGETALPQFWLRRAAEGLPQIASVPDRLEAIQRIARVQAALGDRAGLVKLLEIADGTAAEPVARAPGRLVHPRYSTPVELARAFARVGDHDRYAASVAAARQLLSQLPDKGRGDKPEQKWDGLRLLAVVQAEAGDAAAAMTTLDAIAHDAIAARGYYHCAAVLAVAGKADDSARAATAGQDRAARLTEEQQIYRLPHLVALDSLAAGDPDGARAAAVTIPEVYWRVQVLARVARADAERGDRAQYRTTLEEAMGWAERLAPDFRHFPYDAIARTQRHSDDVAASRRTAARAAEVARSLPDRSDRESSFYVLATMHADWGDVEGCRRFLEAARAAAPAAVPPWPKSDYRDGNYGAVARGYARSGRIEEAEEIAAQLTQPYVRSGVYAALAIAHADAGNSDKAIASIVQARTTEPDDDAITWAVTRLAGIWAERKEFDPLETWIASLNVTDQVRAQLGAAEGLTGRVPEPPTE